MKDFLIEAVKIVIRNADWMGWNLFLAIVPLGLSFILFGRGGRRHRSILWWIGVLTFVAFLPNAPYILTDIIHFISDVQRNRSILTITLVYIPLYLAFLTLGFEAYVLSLLNVRSYLKRCGLARYVFKAEIALHALSAIGIYLGRFLRFNSWQIVTHFDTVISSIDDLLAKRPLIAIAVTFIIISSLYSLLKPVHLALFSRWKSRSKRFVNEECERV